MLLKDMQDAYKLTLKKEGIPEQDFLEGIMIPQAIKAYLSLTRNGEWMRRLQYKKYIDWMQGKVSDTAFDIDSTWKSMRKQLEYESMKATEKEIIKMVKYQEKTLKATQYNGDMLHMLVYSYNEPDNWWYNLKRGFKRMIGI